MARKIGGKWYRRAWAEDSRAAAEREMARMNMGSPHMQHAIVAEAFTDTSSDKSGVTVYSIYFRPKTFKTQKERNSWNRECEQSRKWEASDIRHGRIIQWKRAR